MRIGLRLFAGLVIGGLLFSGAIAQEGTQQTGTPTPVPTDPVPEPVPDPGPQVDERRPIGPQAGPYDPEDPPGCPVYDENGNLVGWFDGRITGNGGVFFFYQPGGMVPEWFFWTPGEDGWVYMNDMSGNYYEDNVGTGEVLMWTPPNPNPRRFQIICNF